MRGSGSPPDESEYFENMERQLEVQTNKQEWKVVPCTHPECDTDLVVNTFYAPAKARCSQHGTAKAAAVAVGVRAAAAQESGVPNASLGKLLCPVCQNPLTIYQIDDTSGFITFHCTDGSHFSARDAEGSHYCGTSVTVRIGGAWVDMRRIPTKFAQLVEDFNVGQKVEYFDKREASNAINTPDPEPGSTVSA
jgi:hypothetical protein